MDNYSDLLNFLGNRVTLRKLAQEDRDHERRLRLSKGFHSPTAFPAGVFSHLVLETARATGVSRRKSEQVQTYLKRALTGKTICVVGTRYGLLNKVFETFGAKTYGVDIDPDATSVAKSRRVNIATESAEHLSTVFPGKKPNFIVSFQFFDPAYWIGREKELPHVLRGIIQHSTPQTIHLHQTFGQPTKFEPLQFHSSVEHSGSIVSRLYSQKR
ncbi:MAG: methyltransferase domain-containing protein [Candidatus Micrarchaeota archaeon]|nr:methyltransferase domain-containing protein [Candidatus Micrarchaeota archaeon]